MRSLRLKEKMRAGQKEENTGEEDSFDLASLPKDLDSEGFDQMVEEAEEEVATEEVAVEEGKGE